MYCLSSIFRLTTLVHGDQSPYRCDSRSLGPPRDLLRISKSQVDRHGTRMDRLGFQPPATRQETCPGVCLGMGRQANCDTGLDTTNLLDTGRSHLEYSLWRLANCFHSCELHPCCRYIDVSFARCRQRNRGLRLNECIVIGTILSDDISMRL